ncbi:hypothetical protein Tco_0227023 [Tanacetum coccineum]
MTLVSSADKPSKTFDELMRTPIDFSAYIMNGLKITNLTQETLLGPAFKLLKDTRSNYAELEYDFEECYKASLKKHNWENPKGDDYPFDLTKPLPLVMSGNCQKVPVDYFFNIDLKYLQGGVSRMTYTTSITKMKAAQYDLPGIEDMVPNIWIPVKVAYDKYALWGISHWREHRKTFYGYAQGLESRHDVYFMKCILAVTAIEVVRSDELYKFSDRTLTRLRTSLDDITKNIRMGFNTIAGNPVKEILLKLNLPNHRSSLTDLKEFIKMDVERRSVKVKELQERCIIKAFKLSYQEKYEHVSPKSQDHKMARLQDDVKRL